MWEIRIAGPHKSCYVREYLLMQTEYFQKFIRENGSIVKQGVIGMTEQDVWQRAVVIDCLCLREVLVDCQDNVIEFVTGYHQLARFWGFHRMCDDLIQAY